MKQHMRMDMLNEKEREKKKERMYIMQYHSLFHVNYFINASFLLICFHFRCFVVYAHNISAIVPRLAHIFGVAETASTPAFNPIGMHTLCIYWIGFFFVALFLLIFFLGAMQPAKIIAKHSFVRHN